MITDPSHPDYNATARDAIMDLCPFYDPHHKCGVVREKVFKECLTELRERNRVTLEREIAQIRSAWGKGVSKWRENHESVPTAFVELANIMDSLPSDAYSDPA